LRQNGKRLDTRTTGKTIKDDSTMAAVGKINGPKTIKGKAVSSQNAFKSGEWLLLRDLRRALKVRLEAINSIE
jgi:hypothetical protein